MDSIIKEIDELSDLTQEEEKLEVDNSGALRERFGEPPFSILDSKSGTWQKRKKEWKEIGIKSELGRDNLGGGNI